MIDYFMLPSMQDHHCAGRQLSFLVRLDTMFLNIGCQGHGW